MVNPARLLAHATSDHSRPPALAAATGTTGMKAVHRPEDGPSASADASDVEDLRRRLVLIFGGRGWRLEQRFEHRVRVEPRRRRKGHEHRERRQQRLRTDSGADGLLVGENCARGAEGAGLPAASPPPPLHVPRLGPARARARRRPVPARRRRTVRSLRGGRPRASASEWTVKNRCGSDRFVFYDSGTGRPVCVDDFDEGGLAGRGSSATATLRSSRTRRGPLFSARTRARSRRLHGSCRGRARGPRPARTTPGRFPAGRAATAGRARPGARAAGGRGGCRTERRPEPRLRRRRRRPTPTRPPARGPASTRPPPRSFRGGGLVHRLRRPDAVGGHGRGMVPGGVAGGPPPRQPPREPLRPHLRARARQVRGVPHRADGAQVVPRAAHGEQDVLRVGHGQHPRRAKFGGASPRATPSTRFLVAMAPFGARQVAELDDPNPATGSSTARPTSRGRSSTSRFLQRKRARELEKERARAAGARAGAQGPRAGPGKEAKKRPPGPRARRGPGPRRPGPRRVGRPSW